MAESRAGGSAGDHRLADDLVLPFRTVRSGVIGRLVRLGSVVDGILGRHAYPDPVSRILGEAVALTALLGSSLKFDNGPGGRLILQTKTDGPLGLLVVDFEEPGRVRAYASFNKERIGTGRGAASNAGEILGSGHLAMTIDPGGNLDRYQGIVPLANDTLAAAAHSYFRQSEQIPTYLRLAVARQYTGSAARAEGHAGWHWRAGGLLIQYMPRVEAGNEEQPDDDGRSLIGEDDDRWIGTRMLASTVEDHELLDPTLSPEALLYRLFAEEGVRAHPAIRLQDRCRCSRDRVGNVLGSFAGAELKDMREPDGAITVTCEFCNTKYRFETDEIAG